MRNTSFSEITPRLQLFLDSTSLGALKCCPRYYKFTIIDGWTPRETSCHLTFGAHYHSALEHYDHAKFAGASHEEATDFALKHVLEVTWNSELNRPWISDNAYKNRWTLVRTVLWYLEEFKDDTLKTVKLANGKPAVELSFRFETSYKSPAGEPYLLCGHLDRVATLGDDTYIVDRKAQPKTAKVLGKNGWIKIGNLQVGDEIAGQNGQFISVKGLYPKGVTPVYKVEFQDGTETTCADNHLWQVARHYIGASWQVKNLTDFLLSVNNGSCRYHVPLAEPIAHPEQELPLDPYLLGVLLGDGYLGGNCVCLSSGNNALMQNVHLAVERMGDILRKSPSDNLVWSITNNRKCNTLRALKEMNLMGCLSLDKFVPTCYLHGSISQRRALLQGLLDTDGSWDRHHRRYQTISTRLALDVCDLVRSLGGSASLSKRSDGVYKVQLRMEDTPVKPRRKYFKKITRLLDAETVCIEVDAADGLYVTDDYIVTHNTSKSAIDERFIASFTPDNQFTLYALAGQVVYQLPIKGLIVDGAQVGVGFSRFGRGFANRTKEMLEEWYAELPYWLRQLEHYAETGVYPANEKSCGNYSGCPFRGVCSKPPKMREQWLKAGFSKRVWDPRQTRGNI